MATSVTSQGLKAASDKVLIALKPQLETIQLFTTDFSADFAKKCSAVAVNVISASTENFDPANGAGFAHGTNTIKPATVQLSTHKKSTFCIGDGDALENELDPCWSKFGPAAGRAIAGDIVSAIMALPTVANAEASIVQANYSTLAHFTEIWAAFENKNAFSPADCVLLLTPAAYAALLNVLPANVKGDGGAALASAQIGQFLGWKAVLPSANLSTTSNAYGYIVPSAAIAVAARLFKPLKAGGNLLESGSITDENTGLVMGSRVVVDANAGETFWNVDCLFGAALTKQNSNGAPGYYAIVTA